MQKLKNLTGKLKNFEKRKQLSSVKEVLIFAAITLFIHYTYNLWAHHYYRSTITLFNLDLPVSEIYAVFTRNLLHVSSWVVEHIPWLKITVVKMTIYISDKGYITINEGCSGLKQYIQFALLMMLYPGPWKKKLWFIPMGLIVVYLTNIFRIVGLVIVLSINPGSFHFSHDYIFRPLFYVVIFLMWVYWVEKIKNKSHKKPAGEKVAENQ